jgi:hypothetical protein
LFAVCKGRIDTDTLPSLLRYHGRIKKLKTVNESIGIHFLFKKKMNSGRTGFPLVLTTYSTKLLTGETK